MTLRNVGALKKKKKLMVFGRGGKGVWGVEKIYFLAARAFLFCSGF